MSQYLIELTKEIRDDGSVHISCADLPMFSVVGENLKSALSLVEVLLPEYLKANVPQYVDLKSVPSASELFAGASSPKFPMHMLFRTGEVDDSSNSRNAA